MYVTPPMKPPLRIHFAVAIALCALESFAIGVPVLTLVGTVGSVVGVVLWSVVQLFPGKRPSARILLVPAFYFGAMVATRLGMSAQNALAAHGMKVIDVEELPTQGGSIRVYAVHTENVRARVSPRVHAMLEREALAGLAKAETYRALAARIAAIKLALIEFLVSAKKAGKSVVCFGAAAKGNTLLNYCGVHADFVDYAVDSSPHKQGLFLPGSRIPIHGPSRINETRPDYVLILPWNLCGEITTQMAGIREWGGQFVVAVPELRVWG